MCVVVLLATGFWQCLFVCKCVHQASCVLTTTNKQDSIVVISFFSVTSYRKEPAQSQDRVGTSVAREDWLMLLSPGSAEKVSKIRVKNREPVPSYRMDRNDDEIDAMMVSQTYFLAFLKKCHLEAGSRSLTLLRRNWNIFRFLLSTIFTVRFFSLWGLRVHRPAGVRVGVVCRMTWKLPFFMIFLPKKSD